MAFAALLLASGCSIAEPARTVVIEPDRPFSLKPGEVASLSSGGVRIGFDGVSADSRCPKGEKCIRAGEATLRLWIEQAARARQVVELRTAPPAAQSVAIGVWSLRLLRLDPYPVSGRPIQPADYAALLLLVAPGDASSAER